MIKAEEEFWLGRVETLKSIINNMSENRTLTNGEFRVGIGFNPGGTSAVDQIKRAGADFIDLVEKLGTEHKKEIEDADVSIAEKQRRTSEVGRLVALSCTAIEHGTMDGVKAVTK